MNPNLVGLCWAVLGCVFLVCATVVVCTIVRYEAFAKCQCQDEEAEDDDFGQDVEPD